MTIQELKFDNSMDVVQFSFSLFAYNRAAANAVNDWLRGAGELIISTHPDRIYSASVYGAYNWTEDKELSDTFTTTVNMIVHPCPFCEVNAEYTVLSGQSFVISNIHNADAFPLITISRTEEDAPITLRIGTLDVLNMTNGNIDVVTIDCDAMECYDGNMSQINEYCREFPMFVAGKDYNITVSGGDAHILPRWRCNL